MPIRLWRVLQEWLEMVKIEHTVFALPFALSGMVLAVPKLPGVTVVVWTVLAFAGARAAAMTLNRLIDAEIDKDNPRTSKRAIPAGRITKTQALVFVVSAFALMVYAASNLPRLCLYLSPVAVAWLSFYSYTKRFTWACHFVLGIALGGAALGGWIASSGQVLGLAPWLLAFCVSTWVAGFDIIYACQDVDFDQSHNLYSLPARFGVATSLGISAALHALTVMGLCILGFVLGVGWFFWLGVVVVAFMLIWEHSLVGHQDLLRVNEAFFSVNGYVSIAIFVAIVLDKISH
ncbi:MAG: UbiA family prenyltransferase [Candidatus Melainabacteria bacterium]|nr:UbiA family prenyltransferase [Candidatus Melainabacteria bacterium]